MRFPGVAFINGRMSMGARLGMLSLVFVVPTAILLTMFVSKCLTDISFSKSEQAGTQYLASIWPAYRGAAASMRDGGGAASALAAVSPEFDAKFKTTGPSQAFASASGDARIAAGVDYIDEVADGSNLSLDPESASYSLVKAVAGSLPEVISDSAAVRAAASLPGSDPTRSTLIAESLQRLRTSARELDGALGDAMKSDPALRGPIAPQAEALRAAIAKIEAHKTDLLAGAEGSVFFTEIEALQQDADKAWLASHDALDGLLKARLAKLNEEMIANLAMALTAMTLAGVLATIIAVGLSGRIKALLSVMDRLVAGDAAVDVPHTDDRNETGRIAATVMAFKQSLIDGATLREKSREQEAQAEQKRIADQARDAASAQEQAEVVSSVALGLEKLSAGALTFRITKTFVPAYEKLRTDFNAAMEQLQDTMMVVADNAAGIRSGAGEISQASDDLSRRTEQQAASLEETAAALDQITATVRRTAEGSSQARETVTAAKSGAEQSGEVVREAISAMGEIEGSARQISQIIGVIDEIAFQTNLLALNAGVEAARAGDAGRGFAVVASEVRALAQRSAEAAKEIKTLISASTQQVDRGVTLVGDTGKALTKIVGQVAEISTLVTEIAASAQEQASGLAQVNTAVNQMDQVTQQNAAMVEQSTAASHALARESEELARLISRFELGAEIQTKAARPAPAKAHTPVTAMRTTTQRAATAPARRSDVLAEQSWDEF